MGPGGFWHGIQRLSYVIGSKVTPRNVQDRADHGASAADLEALTFLLGVTDKICPACEAACTGDRTLPITPIRSIQARQFDGVA